MTFLPNSGGGRASSFTTDDGYILSKPYDTGDTQLDEMLEELYKAVNRAIGSISDNTLNVSDILTQIALLNAAIISLQAQIDAIIAGGGGGGASISTARVSLADSDIKTLASTPFAVVSAPGAGYIVVPTSAVVHTYHATGYSGSRNISFFYEGNANDLMPNMLAVQTTAIDRYLFAGPSNAIAADVAGGETTVNKRIMVHTPGGGGGDVTGGNAANFVKIAMTYITMAELI